MESPAELKPTDTDPNLSDKNKDKQEQKLEPDPKALPAGNSSPGRLRGLPPRSRRSQGSAARLRSGGTTTSQARLRVTSCRL